MGRIAILALVAVIGMAVLAVPPAAAWQDEIGWAIGAGGTTWEGVSRPEPPMGQGNQPVPSSPNSNRISQPYSVFFSTDYAAVPEMTEFAPEFMIVVVQSGTFALDARAPEPGIVVFPAPVTPDGVEGNPIPLMQPKMADAPYYVLTDPVEYLQDPSGGDCTYACRIPPGTVVQLNAGDRIAAREGALCVWCLLNSNFTTTDEADPTNKDDQGLLEVFVLLEKGNGPNSFSWIKAWNKDQGVMAKESERLDSGTAPGAANSERTMLAWAFNPPTHCDS